VTGSAGRRAAGAARHELPAIDEAALAAARACDRLVETARARDAARWAAYFAPLPDHLRDDDLAELRRSARRARSAFGPKDSVRDALPPDVTEPLLEAIDRLLRALARWDAGG
jgi:hypothetical protein